MFRMFSPHSIFFFNLPHYARTMRYYVRMLVIFSYLFRLHLQGILPLSTIQVRGFHYILMYCSVNKPPSKLYVTGTILPTIVCVLHIGYDVPRACLSSPSDSHSPTRTVARAVTVVLYPVGIDNKYNLYVSWQTSRNDGK